MEPYITSYVNGIRSSFRSSARMSAKPSACRTPSPTNRRDRPLLLTATEPRATRLSTATGTNARRMPAESNGEPGRNRPWRLAWAGQLARTVVAERQPGRPTVKHAAHFEQSGARRHQEVLDARARNRVHLHLRLDRQCGHSVRHRYV